MSWDSKWARYRCDVYFGDATGRLRFGHFGSIWGINFLRQCMSQCCVYHTMLLLVRFVFVRPQNSSESGSRPKGWCADAVPNEQTLPLQRTSACRGLENLSKLRKDRFEHNEVACGFITWTDRNNAAQYIGCCTMYPLGSSDILNKRLISLYGT